MIRENSIQQKIFQQIKEKLPPNLSLVFEVSKLLNISQDSAYRRIRCEKELSLEELFLLKKEYNIALDNLGAEDISKVNFTVSLVDKNFKVINWLDILYNDTKKIFACRDKEIIYTAKDPPIFHYFHLPEIAAFKIFFWEKTLFQFPEYEEKMFSFDDFQDDVYEKGRKALNMATKIPTIEIWNNHTFKIMLSQIEFYYVSGFFKHKDDLENLMDKMEKWIHHIQKEVELGYLFMYGSEPEGLVNSYRLYTNEVVMNDNHILVRTEYGYKAYLTFNVLSLLQTSNQSFCIELDRYFRGLMTKSNLISHSGAKERNRFFSDQFRALEKLKSNIL